MFLKIQTKDKSGNTLNKLVNELLATICKIFMNLAFDFKFYCVFNYIEVPYVSIANLSTFSFILLFKHFFLFVLIRSSLLYKIIMVFFFF